MGLVDDLLDFRNVENEANPVKQTWYLLGASALIGAGEGEQVLSLYRLATKDLPLHTAKLVQRRLKEAILKSTIFTGVPRTAAATRMLYQELSDEELDRYAPRYDSYSDPKEAERREVRGKQFFDVLWTPSGAERVRETMKKYHPDLYLLNQKLIYEFWGSEDRILNNVESELVAIAALITMNCSGPLTWHLKGALRHGATKLQVQFAYDLGMVVAQSASIPLKSMPKVEDIDLNDTTYL